MTAGFVDFPKQSVIFCTKRAWYRMAGPIPHRAAPYEEFFFSLGAVATIALWKSAPMVHTGVRELEFSSVHVLLTLL